MLHMKDKRVAIFGSAVGFGRTVALEFAEAGAHVFLFDHDSRAAQVANAIKGNGGYAQFHEFDACDVESFPKIFEAVFQNHGLDGLIYLPRAREERDFRKTTLASWDR